MSLTEQYGKERMSTFLLSLSKDRDDELSQLSREARENGVPVIRRESEDFLRVLLSLKRPESILEIGCAVGYSSLFFLNHLGDVKITTIERDPEMIAQAENNFRRLDPDGHITLMKGDAAKVLDTLTDSYDLIFMDAAKGQYLHFLPKVLARSKRGTLLISDNVLQEGDILESHYEVKRRNRTIYHRMRAYLKLLYELDGVENAVLPVGDGIAVTHILDPERAERSYYEKTGTSDTGRQS